MYGKNKQIGSGWTIMPNAAYIGTYADFFMGYNYSTMP